MASNHLEREDYTEPNCPFCTDFYSEKKKVQAIDIDRVIQKLDEYLDKNNYQAAEQTLKYWLREAENGNDLRGKLSLENELMGLKRKCGCEKEAVDAAEKALDLLNELKLDETVTAATTFVNAATVYKAFGYAEKALPLYGSAKTIYEDKLEPGDGRLGGLYNNMALALSDVGRYKEAREYFAKAIEIMKQIDTGEADQAISWLNLANTAEAEKGLEEASDEITSCLDKAQQLLNSDTLPKNGYYAFVCEKCAPTFEYYGYFGFANELKERSRRIYEGT
jgi:tetratricopeptide (TPR) repeat protein